MQQQEGGRNDDNGVQWPRLLLSIVIASHNYARFLPEAIHSALAQTYSPLEVIVIDDGSTDGSRAIIEDFGDRVTAIFQANQGQTSVINRGFSLSHGDAVVFLDADDRLHDSVAQEIAAVWRAGLAKVQYGLEIINGEGRSLGIMEPHFPRDYTPERLRRQFAATNTYNWPPSSGNAFARAFLAELLPLPTGEFSLAPDGILNTVAPLYGDILTLARPLGCYRIHGSNMWALDRFDLARIDEYLAQRQKEVDFLRRKAQERGIVLAVDDPLDHSLPFLCYRLVQAKLKPRSVPGLPGPTWLCLRAWRYLSGCDLSWRRYALECLWFVAVTAAPHGPARRLIELRFAPLSRPAWLTRLVRGMRTAPHDARGSEPSAHDRGIMP